MIYPYSNNGNTQFWKIRKIINLNKSCKAASYFSMGLLIVRGKSLYCSHSRELLIIYSAGVEQSEEMQKINKAVIEHI